MATPSSRMFFRLEGLFSVYKPQGVHWKQIRDTIETNLLKGINAAPSPAPQLRVKFALQPNSNQGPGDLALSATSLPAPADHPLGPGDLALSATSLPAPADHPLGPGDLTLSATSLPAPADHPLVPGDLTLSATSIPALAHHPLVTGPPFRHIKVGVGHRLDIFSSGVLVLGVGHGNKALSDLYHAHETRDYILEGEFGKATDSFIPSGRLIERSTYDHITRDKLDKVLAMLQGVNQKALLTYSKIDMDSQEAYELAAKGALRPAEKTPPILLGLRCRHFEPPHFTLEVQCMNETQRYLCKVLHEVGLELRSTAVCRGVRRIRDGTFHVQDALTRSHWNAPDVIQAIKQYHASKKARKRAQTHTENSHVGAQVENPDGLRQAEGEHDATVAALH